MNDRLFRLLPAHLRMQDEQADGALRALLAIVSEQLQRVDANIEQLYDNWFIETCEEWVVPYIGDLLGVTPQYVFDANVASLRPLVANTLGFRRRKGTAAMLEDVARAVTGWPARASEMFRSLAVTQHQNHLAGPPRSPNLRDASALELVGSPFETVGRFAEVRRIAPRRGRYNLGNVAIFVWRLLAIPLEGVPARGDATAGPGRFRFNALGVDVPLFNPARTKALEDRLEEPDVPGPLRRRALYDELVAARAALAAGTDPSYRYFAAEQPAFRIVPFGESAIAPELIQICNLEDWSTLPAPIVTTLPGGGTSTTRVAVDPRLGRIAFVSGAAPDAVHVDYSFGFSDEVASGGYDRSAGFEDVAATVYTVTANDPSLAVDAALEAAIAQWVTEGRPDARFEIEDSAVYSVAPLAVPDGVHVEIRAADHQRPVLRLDGSWAITLDPDATLLVDGVLVAGAPIEVTTAGPAGPAVDHHLTLRHCTVVPGLDSSSDGSPASPEAVSLLSTSASTGRLRLRLQACVCGRIDARDGDAAYESAVTIEDGIVDAATGVAPALAGHDIQLSRVTVLGATTARSMSASECIFDETVLVTRTQIGCVRYCYVPPGSIVPRTYRCQPDLAIELAPGVDQATIRARVVPAFVSRHYPQPGYAQLGASIPEEIRTGAEDGGQIGAFHRLHEPQRESNLRTSLDEYLRFGLEAGVFFVT